MERNPDAPTLYRSYDVKPTAGPAPPRLGTRDLDSFLRGGLDKVAVYPRCLTAEEIKKNYRSATVPARRLHPVAPPGPAADLLATPPRSGRKSGRSTAPRPT